MILKDLEGMGGHSVTSIKLHDVDKIYSSLIILLSPSTFEHQMLASNIEQIAEINNDFAISILKTNRIILKDKGFVYKKLCMMFNNNNAADLSKNLTLSHPPLLEEFTLSLGRDENEGSYSCFNLSIVKGLNALNILRDLSLYLRGISSADKLDPKKNIQQIDTTIMFRRI